MLQITDLYTARARSSAGSHVFRSYTEKSKLLYVEPISNVRAVGTEIQFPVHDDVRRIELPSVVALE